MSHMSVFADYADVLAAAPRDLHALLHPHTGFAPSIAKICRLMLAELTDPHDIQLVQLELDTWLLLQALMAARKTSSPTSTLTPNPYTPTCTLAQAILHSSPLLTELVMVREWLHDTAPPPPIPEATTGYSSFTKHILVQTRRLPATTATGLVDSLDPDATTKNDTDTHLASDDASYERSLLQSLYAHIRAGRLEDAIQLCRRAHQPWRAASIRGALLFRWNGISTDPSDAIHPEDGDEEDHDPGTTCHGNHHRTLWKSSVTRTALTPSLSTPERILYAALCPSPQTFPILRAVCKTWQDHLWATVSVMCEQRASSELHRLAGTAGFGSFWEDGMDRDDDSGDGGETPPAPPPLQETPPAGGGVLCPPDEPEWESEVYSALDALRTVSVSQGPPADHAFHFSQLYVILDRTSTLLDVFAGGLRDGSYHRSPLVSQLTRGTGTDAEYTPLCRFFAHLCLFLRMIDVPVPLMATQAILEAYLRVLEEAGERHLVALYASALGENAVERYALFLVSLGMGVGGGGDGGGDEEEGEEEREERDGVEERRRALMRAREHGLDVTRVAVVAAERTVDKAFELLPPTSTQGPLPCLVGGAEGPLQRSPSHAETFLMRSIEWTTFSEMTYDTALEQACVVLRFFLASGRVKLAQQVLETLPSELSAISDPEERATEYLHYRQFFIVWEALERVVTCQALEVDMGMAGGPSRMGIASSREARAAWLQDYSALLEDACEQVTRLLTAEWLVTNEVDDDASARVSGYGDKRRKELIRIRRIFVPELVIRLHSLLYGSRKWFPSNLKRALDLANVVADSRYKLYEDFLGQDVGMMRLGDYLGAVRLAVLGGLEGGGSDAFAVVMKYT